MTTKKERKKKKKVLLLNLPHPFDVLQLNLNNAIMYSPSLKTCVPSVIILFSDDSFYGFQLESLFFLFLFFFFGMYLYLVENFATTLCTYHTTVIDVVNTRACISKFSSTIICRVSSYS